MATPEPQRDQSLSANGAKLLALGGILAAIGIVLMLVLDGLGDGIGVAFASLACVPTLAGGAMMLSALVSRRSRAGKPFA
jgi:peptidoglycan/LPS O-acetylase OafA/YrhL